MNIFNVVLTKQAKRDLMSSPKYIVRKLQAWIENIEHDGLNEVRKISGYHDEPLKGKRLGQRSIRLSKAYRAIYIIDQDNKIMLIKILEVHKHDY